jgi:hypothetical protein
MVRRLRRLRAKSHAQVSSFFNFKKLRSTFFSFEKLYSGFFTFKKLRSTFFTIKKLRSGFFTFKTLHSTFSLLNDRIRHSLPRPVCRRFAARVHTGRSLVGGRV